MCRNGITAESMRTNLLELNATLGPPALLAASLGCSKQCQKRIARQLRYVMQGCKTARDIQVGLAVS